MRVLKFAAESWSVMMVIDAHFARRLYEYRLCWSSWREIEWRLLCAFQSGTDTSGACCSSIAAMGQHVATLCSCMCLINIYVHMMFV